MGLTATQILLFGRVLGLAMDYAESARRHRLQAEECRAKADLMADGQTRTQYNNMAQSYDQLADNEEKLAVSARAAADRGKAPPPAIEI